MAALWKLPVVYIIENNRYGMGTSVGARFGHHRAYRHGEAFGIPASASTAWTCWRFARRREGVDYARSGKGPYI